MAGELEGESENPMLVRVGETRIINMGTIIDAKFRDGDIPILVLRYPVSNKNGEPLRIRLKGEIARAAWENLYDYAPEPPFEIEGAFVTAAK
jgi:hypothetical protein